MIVQTTFRYNGRGRELTQQIQFQTLLIGPIRRKLIPKFFAALHPSLSDDCVKSIGEVNAIKALTWLLLRPLVRRSASSKRPHPFKYLMTILGS